MKHYVVAKNDDRRWSSCGMHWLGLGLGMSLSKMDVYLKEYVEYTYGFMNLSKF